MNERGDVRGYLRVAVQAVLGREEETVNFPLRPISITFTFLKVDYPLGVRQSARIAFPDSCVGRTEKQGGEGENKPPSTLYSPKPVNRLKTYYFPKYPHLFSGSHLPKILPWV